MEAIDRFREALRLELAVDDTLFPHRAAFEAIDLGNLPKSGKRQIDIAFRGETQERVEEIYYETIADYTDNPKDLPKYEKVLKETISEFLHEQSVEPWTRELKKGDVTIRFTEVSPQEQHPVNLSHEEMFTLDSGDENEILATINGRPFHIHNAELLEDHFPEIIAVADQVKKVEAETLVEDGRRVNFGKVITIEEDEIASVGTNDYLSVGRPMLELARENPDELLNTLRHERGHVANGDMDESKASTRVANDLSFLSSPANLLNLIVNSTEWTAERLADVTNNNLDAMREIRVLDAALTEITPDLRETAQRIRSYPWHDELDAMQVAADQNPETGFVAHMDTQQPRVLVTKPLIVAGQFYDALDPHEDEAYEGLDNGKRVAPLKTALKQLAEKHKDLIADVEEVNRASGFVLQAREILADMHNVRHAENPEKAVESFKRTAGTEGFSSGGEVGDSHPSDDSRIENMGHFARRVLREREQAAKKQDSPSR